MLAPLAPDAILVTVIDAAPATLSWLGGVRGHRVSPLGVDRFGQTGCLKDLYREYRLDVDAIIEAAAELVLGCEQGAATGQQKGAGEVRCRAR